MAIYFYTKNEPNYEYSNFSKYGIECDGLWWETVEHYFQAQKFDNEEYREKIRRAHGPKQAASLGRSRSEPIRVDWNEIRIDVMKRAVRKKFLTHKSLKEMLMATGDEEIVENSPGDYFWGCGKDGSGSNWLGRIIMEIRDELRSSV
ncbi:MAG: NADAR family protein [Pseudomonadota bacterium]